MIVCWSRSDARPTAVRSHAEKAGVNVDARGIIAVDKQMRTNVPHIFAIGDLAGGPMLAHKATHEAKVAAEVAAGEKSYFDARTIPSVAYTDPEIAWVGLTELEAKAKGIDYEKAQFPVGGQRPGAGVGRVRRIYQAVVRQAHQACSRWRHRRSQCR